MSPARRPRKGGGYDSSWIRPTTRLAIYLRDGLGCVYCTEDWSRTDGMTLDHVIPRLLGGGNAPENLVSACRRCNNLRHHIKYSPLFTGTEWVALEKVLGAVPGSLQARVAAHVGTPLAVFRARANVLCRDPPDWLQNLRRRSATTPGDLRLREERVPPPELESLIQESGLLSESSWNDEEIPF